MWHLAINKVVQVCHSLSLHRLHYVLRVVTSPELAIRINLCKLDLQIDLLRLILNRNIVNL